MSVSTLQESIERAPLAYQVAYPQQTETLLILALFMVQNCEGKNLSSSLSMEFVAVTWNEALSLYKITSLNSVSSSS